VGGCDSRRACLLACSKRRASAPSGGGGRRAPAEKGRESSALAVSAAAAEGERARAGAGGEDAAERRRWQSIAAASWQHRPQRPTRSPRRVGSGKMHTAAALQRCAQLTLLQGAGHATRQLASCVHGAGMAGVRAPARATSSTPAEERSRAPALGRARATWDGAQQDCLLLAACCSSSSRDCVCSSTVRVLCEEEAHCASASAACSRVLPGQAREKSRIDGGPARGPEARGAPARSRQKGAEARARSSKAAVTQHAANSGQPQREEQLSSTNASKAAALALGTGWARGVRRRAARSLPRRAGAGTLSRLALRYRHQSARIASQRSGSRVSRSARTRRCSSTA
jgi:hypothetical protein